MYHTIACVRKASDGGQIDFRARRSTELQYTRFMDSMIVNNNNYGCGIIEYKKRNFWRYSLVLVTEIEIFVQYIKEYQLFCSNRNSSVSAKGGNSTPMEIRVVQMFTESIMRWIRSCNTGHLQCRRFLGYLNFRVIRNLYCKCLVATVCTGLTILIYQLISCPDCSTTLPSLCPWLLT